jgi:Tol biopolymer transport system component
MTSQPRFERNLPALLEDLYLGSTPSYRDNLLAAAWRTRQRPAWSFPERWLPVDITTKLAPSPRLPLRQVAIVALLALLAAVALISYAGSHHPVPLPFGPAENGLLVVNRGGDVYTADPKTGELKLVLGNTEDDHAPGFSPDGTQIAFLRGEPGELWVMNADGSQPHRVGAGPVAGLEWANWTPDSRHLVVIGRFDGDIKIRIFDSSASGTYRDLAQDYLPDPAELTFSPPAGNEIVFRAQLRKNPGKMGLFVMNADGTNIRTLVEPTVAIDITMDMAGLAFTPDGQRIFYTHYYDDMHMQLWVMNADGTNRHQFVHVESGCNWEGLPAVSPDGQYVAFWRCLPDNNEGQISIARADGTGSVVDAGPKFVGVTTTYGWSPDSTKLLVIPNESGQFVQPYLLDPTGGPGTRLNVQIEPENPDWQRLRQLD